jgi:hypothetical protein
VHLPLCPGGFWSTKVRQSFAGLAICPCYWALLLSQEESFLGDKQDGERCEEA